MKNVIILILALGTIGGGVYAISTIRMTGGDPGRLSKIVRGDLTIPINATGEVKPARRITIKAEASGEVIVVYKHGGERVRKGELLMRLNKDEEQRSVDRATRDLANAKRRREMAELKLEQAETADLDSAEAAVKQVSAMLPYYRERAERALENPEAFHPEESLQRRTTFEAQRAQLDAAKSKVVAIKLLARQVKLEVAQLAANVETAQDNLRDAERRLDKTDIVSPIDGIVASVETQVGEVIQGGKTTLGGGTVLAVLLDMSRMIVAAEVDESDIGRVLAIAPAWATPGNDGSIKMPEDLAAAGAAMADLPTITVESFRDESFDGIIERIYPEPKKISGVTTYIVDIVIISENRSKLFAGMRAEAEFTAQRVKDVLLCPSEAIREGMGGLGVYVPIEPADPNDDPYAFIACTIGLDNGVYAEIREGVAEGDVVYAKLPVSPRKRKSRK